MANRSRSNARQERNHDSGDSLKPLVVLVLLGTILYGAWSVVNKGPGGTPLAAPDAVGADLASTPVFPPAIEVPAFSAPPAVGPPATQIPASGLSEAVGLQPAPPAAFSSAAAPTYLNAVSAPPPVADPAGPASLAAAMPPAATALAAAPAASFQAPPASGFDAAASRQMPLPPAGFGREPMPSAAFASAWADAHDKLAAGRYAEALAVLSAWHDEPSLGLEESQQLEHLLGQLAGEVIYSQKDLLLPPHVVQPGETLMSIAAPLAVPWPLLAKINGVSDPARLVPGESLKLVRGPFDAVVSVSRRRLSLRVGGSYAGSFPVMVGRQVRERIGSALPVIATQQSDPAADQSGPATQVAWSQPEPRSIGLADGLSIQGLADPTTASDSTIPGASLIVSDRDLAELADILGQGSRVIVRQ